MSEQANRAVERTAGSHALAAGPLTAGVGTRKVGTMDDQFKHYADKLAYEIDSWDLKVAVEAGENITLVDARSTEAFQREHIPAAIDLPHHTKSPETTKHIDKRALVVTYCDGIGCNASTKGALNMLKLGFRVRELIGGLNSGP